MLPTFSYFNKFLCIHSMWVGYFSIHKLLTLHAIIAIALTVQKGPVKRTAAQKKAHGKKAIYIDTKNIRDKKSLIRLITRTNILKRSTANYHLIQLCEYFTNKHPFFSTRLASLPLLRDGSQSFFSTA